MKTLLLNLCLCTPLWLVAQTVDSTAIRQVDSLIQLSRDLITQRDLEQALEVIVAAEKIALSSDFGMGPESATYASCCFNHGRVNHYIGDYPEAEKWYLKSKAIWEKMEVKENPGYASNLNNLAVLYVAWGQYEKAEPLYLESKNLQESVVGKDHPDYATSLNNLAVLYWHTGQYDKAEPLYVEALKIREKALGKKHPHYAASLNNLAALYDVVMSQYEKAEPLYLEAKTIREEALGKDHPEYAESLNNLASLYSDMGQYEKAEPLLLETIAIRGNVLGKEHPDYTKSLGNLGLLYISMGQYEKAESLLLEAKTIREKILGEENPEHASILNNLGTLYLDMGQYEKAESFYLEAKTIWEKALGKDHFEYASSLGNLASLYSAWGQYEKAESLYLESIAICDKVMGKEHPDYAKNLVSLGLLYADTDQYEKAKSLYLESKTILAKVLGKEHPDYAVSLINLACLNRNTGQYEKAELQFLELSILSRTLIGKAVRHLSERELDNYLNIFSARQYQTLSFTQTTGSEKLAPACYDNSLFYKGFLLQAADWVRQLALADSDAAEKLNRLKGTGRRLAVLYSEPIAERDRTLLVQLETQATDLEKDLARTVAGYGEAMRQVQWQEVQGALKPDEAAIEFVYYQYYGKNVTDSIMYAALVLRPGIETPEFIPLFEEKTLDALLRQGSAKPVAHINALYQNPTLYSLLWQPLEKALEEAQTIYFSPDGLLHRLNLRAIATPDGKILTDRYQLIRLSSTRQLVIPSTTKPAANDALVYGGIQYDMDAGAIQKANASLSQPNLIGTRGVLGFHSTDSTLRVNYRSLGEGAAWDYLPFTEVEAGLLQHDLQEAGTSVRVLSGFAATEESFKNIGHPSPRILHMATHGFFFPDPASPNPSKGGDLSNSYPLAGGREGGVFKISDHPMIRSGLLMAGANHAWKSGQPLQPGMEDGILTAYEISQMDLANTELAVLSACETGLGDIAGSEGVYGLQRAFKIAGTRYLLMSLWQVPDRETQELMTTFYRHWLKDKQSVPEAFQTTQQEMRARFKDPFLWAGFVLVE